MNLGIFKEQQNVVSTLFRLITTMITKIVYHICTIRVSWHIISVGSFGSMRCRLPSKIPHLLRSPNDTLNTLSSEIVYRILYSRSAVYNGETSLLNCGGFVEHPKFLRSSHSTKSVFAEHHIDRGHCIMCTSCSLKNARGHKIYETTIRHQLRRGSPRHQCETLSWLMSPAPLVWTIRHAEMNLYLR